MPASGVLIFQPVDPAKSCPHPSLPSPQHTTRYIPSHHPTRNHAILQNERRMVRTVIAAAQSATDLRMSRVPRRTRPALTSALDTHNLQIHGAQALGLQDPKTPEIRRETILEIRRHRARIVTEPAIAKYRRTHHHLHSQDIRPRVRHVPAI